MCLDSSAGCNVLYSLNSREVIDESQSLHGVDDRVGGQTDAAKPETSP